MASARRWTIAGGVTALFGAVAACTSYDSEPDVVAPPTTQEGGVVDAGPETPLDSGLCGPGSSLDTDPKNCGVCAHDCLGGTCTAGACDPVDIAQGLKHLGHLRQRGGALFATTVDGVVRMPVGGGTPANVLSMDDVTTVAVDDTQVYAGSPKGFAVAPVDGSKGPVFVSTFGSAEVAVDGEDLFYCDPGTDAVRRTHRSGTGGANLFVKLAESCESIVLAGSDVFIGGGDGIYRVPRDATSPSSGTSFAKTPSRRMAVDADWLYSIGTPSAAVMRTARKTGEQATIAVLPEPVEIGDIAIDATHVYVTTGRAAGGVYRVRKDGGVVETIAPGALFPIGIAVDDVAIYWTERDGARVRRRAK